jgi:phosphoribosyl-ATP pyrophosphohydrolase/phosphoribosyl-AMP cyclohydrolase/histidinol dehydrogenase
MGAYSTMLQVIADKTANPVFVASDLLSQAEHGIDSQVVLVAIDLDAKLLEEIEVEVDRQARALPRVDIIKQAIKKSLIVKTKTLDEAMAFSNEYAPEHLILHLEDAPGAVQYVNNAGSVFVGAFSPER